MTTNIPLGNQTHQVLADLGLSQRQQLVYLALLTLGRASVQSIAAHADVERTSLYQVLQSLERLGLVGQQIVGKKRLFVAQDPEQLRTLLGRKQAALSEVLPEIKALWTASDVRPRVRYYEGIEGMRTVIDDTLTAPDGQLQGILSTEDLFATVGQRWMDKYVQRRIKAGIHLRVLRSPQKEVGEQWPTSQRDKRALRYTPDGMVFSMTMYVYGTKVALLSTRQENFGMLIESDEFATHQRNLFQALWQISRPTQTS